MSPATSASEAQRTPEDLFPPARSSLWDPEGRDGRSKAVGEFLREEALHRHRLLLVFGLGLALHAIERWLPAFDLSSWLCLALASAALVLGGEVIQNSFLGLSRARLDGDSIAALGALAAFFGGTAFNILHSMGRLAPWIHPAVCLPGVHCLGLDAAVFLLCLPLLSRALEARWRASTIQEILRLGALRPATARVARDGAEVSLPIASLKGHDRVLVRPGERFPVDGCIAQGAGTIDASLLGDRARVIRRPGDRVLAGTRNLEEEMVLFAREPAESCVLHQALELALRAQNSSIPRSPGESITTSILSALGVSLGATVGTLLWHSGVDSCYGVSLTSALAILAILWPGHSILVSHAAAHAALRSVIGAGIIILDLGIFSRCARARVAYFSKTGTLTLGQYQVEEVVSLKPGVPAEEILFLASVLEIRSEHPLARGVLRALSGRQRTVPPLRGFRSIPGKGLRGQYRGKELLLGNLPLLEDAGIDTTPSRAAHRALAERGMTPLVLALGGEILGILGMADEDLPGAAEAIRELREEGLRCVLLTGDCQGTAEAARGRFGLDEARGDLSQSEKVVAARAHRKGEEGMSLAIGRGVPDAPVLAAADAGIALAGAEDLSLEGAGAMVLGTDPTRASSMVRGARANLARCRLSLAVSSAIALAAAAGYTAYVLLGGTDSLPWLVAVPALTIFLSTRLARGGSPPAAGEGAGR